MLYASDLARFAGRFDALVEKDLDDLPDLVARLLSREVERRMRRNLSRGYRRREAVLTRLRGRIDLLATTTERLRDRAEVACRPSHGSPSISHCRRRMPEPSRY